jgi:hypothetical protein
MVAAVCMLLELVPRKRLECTIKQHQSLRATANTFQQGKS